MNLRFLLLFAFINLAHQLSADLIEGKCGDGVFYLYDTDSRKMIIQGNGPMYDYEFNTSSPFYTFSHHMQSLVIEHGITHIGDRAFWGCYALGGHITLPMSVTSVGDEAFYNCSYLTKLVLGPLIVSIGDRAFASCSELGDELVFPATLKNIGYGAFSGCKQLNGSLSIPNSVETIGEDAFSGCEGFHGTLYLGTSLKSIGEGAFRGAINLTGDLVIPESVNYIGRYAFDGCKYLSGKVVVPKGVTTIEDGVFRHCSAISGITLLGQVTSIGNSAFNYCSSLTDFLCYATTPPNAFEYHIFDNIPLKTVYVPAESVNLYKAAYNWKNFEILPIGGSSISSSTDVDKVSISICGDKLQVDAGSNIIKSVLFVNINGILLFAEKTESSYLELDMSFVPSGIYIVKVMTEDGEYSRKLIR